MVRSRIFAAAASLALAAGSSLAALVVVAVFAGRVLLDAVVMPAARGCPPLAAALVTLLIAAILAASQANAAAGATVDVQPFLAQIIDLAIMVIGPPLGLAIVGALLQLIRWAGAQTSATQEAAIRATVDQVLDRARDYGRAKVGATGPIPVALRSEAVAHAAGYAMEAMPGALKKLGIADKASARLSAMVEARLGPSPA